VEMYRAIDHNMTGKSPVELLFNQKIRGKLPNYTMPRNDQEIMMLNKKEKTSFTPITAVGQIIHSWKWETKS